MRDELEKIAISRERLRIVAQGRKGTRPISVEKFLKREKDGTLYRITGNHTKVADISNYAGSPVPFSLGPFDAGEARKPKKAGDAPSKEGVDNVGRGDLRESATTVTGLGQSFNNIAATGNSAGGT